MVILRRKVAARGRSRQSVVMHTTLLCVVLLACWMYSSGLWSTFNIFAATDSFEVSMINGQSAIGIERFAGSTLHHNHNETTNDDGANIVRTDTFHPDNLDLTRSIPCGANKCFFRIKGAPRVGYLATLKRFGSERDWFHEMESSYHLAMHLEEKYSIQHLLLDHPTRVIVTKALATRMNANLWRESDGSPPHYTEGATAILQKSRAATEPNLLIGNSPDKMKMLERHLGAFVASIQDKELFARQFAENMNVTRNIVKEQPCLLRDFQALVDTEGQLYHFDLDRCFELGYQSVEWALIEPNLRDWLEAFGRIERQVLQTVAISR